MSNLGARLLLAASILLAGCDPPEETKGNGWRLFRIAHNDRVMKLAYLYVDPKSIRMRDVYDAAATKMCADRVPESNICIVGFYADGDRLPEGDYLNWENTNPVVVWWENKTTGMREYTSWDCARGPVDEAPASALCGKGFREMHKAVLDLAGREGLGVECGWPTRKNLTQELQQVIASAPEGRRQYLRDQFENAVARTRGARTRNPGYDCQGYRAKLDAFVAAALAAWKAAIR